MAERGIAISYESIRLWCIKFGPKYAKRLRRRHPGYGDTFLSTKSSSRFKGSNTIFGGLSTRTAKWLMCFYNADAMAMPLSASSSAYCERVVMNRDVSSPINFEATVSLTVN